MWDPPQSKQTWLAGKHTLAFNIGGTCLEDLETGLNHPESQCLRQHVQTCKVAGQTCNDAMKIPSDYDPGGPIYILTYGGWLRNPAPVNHPKWCRISQPSTVCPQVMEMDSSMIMMMNHHDADDDATSIIVITI